MLRGLGHVDVGTDHPHTEGARDCTDQEELSSPELVDQEQQPHKSHDGFDDAEDAGHQVHGVRFNAQALFPVSVFRGCTDCRILRWWLTEKIVGE